MHVATARIVGLLFNTHHFDRRTFKPYESRTE